MTYDLNLREYWRTIRKRKVIALFTVVMMTGFSFIFSILGRPTPIYKTSASVKVERSHTLTGLYLQSIYASDTNYMETQSALIKSYYMIEMAAKKLGSIPADTSSDEVRNNPRYLSMILTLKEKIQTEQEGNSDIINITATADDPQYAQRLANTVAQVYKERHALDLNRRVIEAKRFIEGQVLLIREKLQNSEEAIKAFREANRMVSLDVQSSGLLGQISAIQAACERDQTTLARINTVSAFLSQAEERPLTSKNSFYFEEASAPYKSLNDRLVQLMLERDLLLINYTENFPQVVEIKKQVHEIITSMQAQLQAQQQSFSQSVTLAKRQLKSLDEQLKSLPAKGLELARLERDVGVNREIYTLLEKQYQEALIQNVEKPEEVQIVKPALEPTEPINQPKTAATTGLGFIIGIILGVVFAFLVETFDTSIGAVEEVEEFLGHHVLGVIPHVDFNELRENLKEKLEKEVTEEGMWRIGRLVSHFAPKTTSAESYRALRTNINFVKLENNIKTIVFTSSSPQEGKTTVSINLAITMAQAGNRVLLVDGDFRRPVISKIFGIPSLPGLTDAILGNCNWRDAVRSITDLMMGKMTVEEIMVNPGLDNLHIMTCGTIAPNPAELVNTKINTEFIKESRSEYDFVIIDAPPVLAATDAALWGTKADGVIIVYQVGKIARGALKRAKAQIDNVKAKIIGIVLNGLKAEISPDYEYHDKYYYYYGSERKRELSLGQKVLTWPERAETYFSSLTKRLKRSGRGEETAKGDAMAAEPGRGSATIVKEPPTLKSRKHRKLNGKFPSILLILALGLLAAGVYFTGLLDDLFSPPIRSGNITVITPPPEVKSPQPQIPVPSETPSVPAPQPVQSAAAEGPAAEDSLPAGKTPATPVTAEQPATLAEKKAPISRDVVPSSSPTKDEVPDRRRPYAVQVRATKDARLARDTVDSLRMRGHDAYSEQVALADGFWHRIFIGAFASEKEARQYVETKKIASVYPDFMIRKMANAPGKAQEKGSGPLDRKSVPR